MTPKVLKKSNPNRHGWVKLLQYDEGDDATYVVTDPWDEDGTEFDGSLSAATEYYDARVQKLAEIPNWEAQAEYDEAHGTDNGYAPWQLNREY